EILEQLGDVDARLKVTLSYYIEPGPGQIGWKDKYRYSSAALRFDVIKANETQSEFEKRINRKMRDDDDSVGGSGRKWYLGPRNRDVGSIHSDFCETSAIDLSDASYIAVYPVVGWWRERRYLGRSKAKMRYSLVVSIETPSVNADLYTPIVTQISNPIQIKVDL
ncbi:MAG: hypothetical protein K0Q56_831, partial [Sporolactobacillus laevolacticus]|nr:hypothetical protein [Sporolactobacillus laevolacticus]